MKELIYQRMSTGNFFLSLSFDGSKYFYNASFFLDWEDP